MALTITAPSETAGAEAMPAAPEQTEQLTVAVTLDPPFSAWLAARAQAHGEEPGAHAAAILRQYWAHHDAWRHEHAGAPTRRRGAA
jgi:hypothetical protein